MGNDSELTERSKKLQESIEKLTTPVRVLLVDDNADDLGLAKSAMLEVKPDAIVDCVMSGAAAMEKLSQSAYDFVLLDLRMPPIDGLAVLAKLKGSGLAIPVVTLSGLDNGPLVLKAIELGAVLHVRKSQLKRDLSELLNIRKT